MATDSIQILRLNAEYDALIHACRPLLLPGEPNTEKATRWISILSNPVSDLNQAETRVKHARNLLRRMKSNEPLDDIPYEYNFVGQISNNRLSSGQVSAASSSYQYQHQMTKPSSAHTHLDNLLNQRRENRIFQNKSIFDSPSQSNKLTANNFNDVSSVSSSIYNPSIANYNLDFPKTPVSSSKPPLGPKFESSYHQNGDSLGGIGDNNGVNSSNNNNNNNLSSIQMATHLHEYKLQLQKASDMAMEKIIERKNKEILDIKNEFHEKNNDLSNQVQEIKLSRDTLENQIEECLKQNELLKREVAENNVVLAEQKSDITQLQKEKIQLETEKVRTTDDHRKQLQDIVDSTTERLQNLERTVQKRDADHHNEVLKFQQEIESLKESKSFSEDLITDLKKKMEEMNKKSISEANEASYKLIEKEKVMTEKIHQEKQRANNLEAQNVLKISELESSYKQQLVAKNNEIHDLNSKNRDLKDDLTRSETRNENYQKEIDEILEQADEKITQMKEEREEVVGQCEKNAEEALNSLRERLTEQKSQDFAALRRDFDGEKRLLSLEHEKRLDLETQTSKKLQEKIDHLTSQQTQHLNSFETEKSKLIQEFQARLELTTKALDETRQEKLDLKLDHDRNIANIQDTNNNYVSDLKNSLSELNAKLEKERNESNNERETRNLEIRNHLKKVSHLEQDLFLANENYSQMEEKAEKLNNELNDLEKRRKQQLLDLGILREQEKQESERKHLQNFEKAAGKMKNEFSMKLEDKLNNLRKKHRKELECLDVQLKDVERKYRDKCSEHEKRKNEFSLTSNNMKTKLKKAERDFSDKVAELKSTYEDLLNKERSVNEEKTAELVAEMQLEKTRFERAERRLTSAELQHRNEIDDLKIKFSKETEDLLPKTVQLEFENTIDHLRSQVDSLHKTVRGLMSKHRVNDLVQLNGPVLVDSDGKGDR